MPKSKAEIMREYRKKMKQDPEKYQEYLAKARGRKKQNYVPAKNLTKKERMKRNERNKEYLQRHRQKKKIEQEIENAREQLNQSTPETSGYDTGPSPMVVNFSFPNRRNGPKKRLSRTLANKQKALGKLKNNYDNLQLKYKRTLRSLQRLKKSKKETKESKANRRNEDPVIMDCEDNNSPTTKTKHMMAKAGLSRRQKSKVQKQLLFSFAVQNKMRSEKRCVKANEKSSLRTHIGSILQKYGLKKSVSKNTGFARNCLKGLSVSQIVRQRETRKYKDKVYDFLTRDDNSRANPGKRDKLKSNGKVEQTRTLSDYMKNLHQKFLSENPLVKLSLTSFCRMRPKHIKLSAFITRSSCLCTRHQNMALSARAIRGCGLHAPINPEELLEDKDVTKMLEQDLPGVIKLGQWKRVPVEEKGRKKMVMKVVESEMKKDEFLKFVRDQLKEFGDHVSRVKRQYDEIGQLKANLRDGEAILHMDFAENYTCKSVEEIQTAYWNKTGVTLHPIVVYYNEEDGTLCHKSIVVVSDEQSHNASVVLAFLDKAIPLVKKVVPNLHRIHYWTDSPSSQYRKKTIFDAVDRHEHLYGVKASWNFFESGHGKGPCDGLGGLTKRLADDAVNMGKATIQDANDFFAWTQSGDCSMKSVDFIFVASQECQRKIEEVGRLTVKPVAGTMKIHAVIGGLDTGVVFVANVSCYCSSCREGVLCDHWKKVTLVRSDVRSNKKSIGAEQTVQDPAEQDEIENPAQQSEGGNNTDSTISDVNDDVNDDVRRNDVEYTEREFVAAVYLNKWYIGEIVDVDDGEIEVNFMKSNKYMTFQWPATEDRIWLDPKDILAKIKKPEATGRSQRAFKLHDDDYELVQNMYDTRN